MATRSPKGLPANDDRDDLLSVLNSEAQAAISRIAERLHIRRSGPEASAKYRLACQAYEARRERAKIFDADLFADPAWDILLAMYREHLASRPMTLDDAARAADVPNSVALRWLDVLGRRGLVSTEQGSQVGLTPEAIEKLEAYMERLRAKSLMRVI